VGPKKGSHNALKHSLYKRIDLSAIDKRTALGKTIEIIKRELRDYVNGGSIVSELLTQRIVYKVVKLSLYEVNQLTNRERPEADHYLPMSNSLRLDLAMLKQLSGKAKGPSLEKYLQGKHNQTEEQ